VSGQSRRETRLPLPQDLGNALWHDLAAARPPVNIAHVVITALAPWRPLSGSGMGQPAARALTRAGLRVPTAGARGWRHSAATTRLRPGASLQTIGDILRHPAIETSAHYAKVAMALLPQVARPWPAEVLCGARLGRHSSRCAVQRTVSARR
jgi:integrase